MSLADSITDTYHKAVTYRTFPGGRRAMYHRWHFSKVKGAHSLTEEIANSLFRPNRLLAYFLKERRARRLWGAG